MWKKQKVTSFNKSGSFPLSFPAASLTPQNWLTPYSLSNAPSTTMGGNALGATRPRLSRQAYNDVVTELKTLLVPKFYGCVEQPRSFASKTSFGDVDLLATLPCSPLDPVNDVGSTASSVNGNILSFEFRGFQIDIIQVSEELMELARFFYGYGDTGMIFGMFTRNIGLKFGMQGLTLKCETYKIKLSHDLNAILQFLGECQATSANTYVLVDLKHLNMCSRYMCCPSVVVIMVLCRS